MSPEPGTLEPHPSAEIFPILDDGDIKALAADIKANGLVSPIVLLDRKILDGRNRYRACQIAGVEPRTVDYDGSMDPLSYVISTNLHRRHLSESQRAMIAARHCKTSDSGSRAAADLLNVSHQLVCDAAKVINGADAETIRKVERGDVRIHKALQGVIRAQARSSPPLPDGRYDVILADPPWQFMNDAGGVAPGKHYATMRTDQIAAMGVRELAAKDAVLFLWAVGGMLPDALDVMQAWGFACKAQIIWHKPDPSGLGYYTTNAHELLLIGSRGSMLPIVRPNSVVTAPRGAHSVKPAVFHELIEKMYPGDGVRRLELFARATRDGWTPWGNEVPTATQAKQVA